MKNFIYSFFFISLALQPLSYAKKISFSYGIGGSKFHGDLSRDSFRPTHLLSVGWPFYQFENKSYYAYLQTELGMTNTAHDGLDFPYGPKASLRILHFLFIPTICKVWTRTHLCGGIGQGTVNVNSHGNRRDYGTWNYVAALKYQIHKDLYALLSTKYVGKVEQQVAGKDTFFSYSTYLLGIEIRR